MKASGAFETRHAAEKGWSRWRIRDEAEPAADAAEAAARFRSTLGPVGSPEPEPEPEPARAGTPERSGALSRLGGAAKRFVSPLRSPDRSRSPQQSRSRSPVKGLKRLFGRRSG